MSVPLLGSVTPNACKNYGDGAVPLDRLFGTAHDGSGEADERMNARLRVRAARLAEDRAQKGVQA